MGNKLICPGVWARVVRNRQGNAGDRMGVWSGPMKDFKKVDSNERERGWDEGAITAVECSASAPVWL